MFISHNREKLLNAIIYFVEQTKFCNTIKLFKLLNFLDFEHYRQTGNSVTGLQYQAWRQGPVPKDLWNELHEPSDDFRKTVVVSVVRDDLTDVPARRDFSIKKKFEKKYFTKRELEIMERLVFFFSEITATQMSQYSHSKNMPWYKIYKGEGKPPELIPYELTLESAPIIKDMPTIDKTELEYRREALSEISASLKRWQTKS